MAIFSVFWSHLSYFTFVPINSFWTKIGSYLSLHNRNDDVYLTRNCLFYAWVWKTKHYNFYQGFKICTVNKCLALITQFYSKLFKSCDTIESIQHDFRIENKIKFRWWRWNGSYMSRESLLNINANSDFLSNEIFTWFFRSENF